MKQTQYKVGITLSLLVQLLSVGRFASGFTKNYITNGSYQFTNHKPWGSVEQFYHDQTKEKQTSTINLFDKVFEEEGPLGKGITVGKVQVALMAPDRSKSSIFGLLDDAGRSSDDSSEGLAEMCNEICMALLRKQSDWVSAASDSRWFSAKDAGKAESQYNEWATKEATKFEKV